MRALTRTTPRGRSRASESKAQSPSSQHTHATTLYSYLSPLPSPPTPSTTIYTNHQTTSNKNHRNHIAALLRRSVLSAPMFASWLVGSNRVGLATTAGRWCHPTRKPGLCRTAHPLSAGHYERPLSLALLFFFFNYSRIIQYIQVSSTLLWKTDSSIRHDKCQTIYTNYINI